MIRKTLAMVTVIAGFALAASPSYAAASTVANQRFTIVTVGPGPGTVIAAGPVTGVGTDVNNRAQLPPGAPFQSTFTFAQGKLFSTVSAAGPPRVQFDPTTCVLRITAHDTFVVTGGTDTLTGASGSGTATANLISVAGRNTDGSCRVPGSPPIFALTLTQATGSVSVG